MRARAPVQAVCAAPGLRPMFRRFAPFARSPELPQASRGASFFARRSPRLPPRRVFPVPA